MESCGLQIPAEIYAPGFYEEWYKPLVEEGYAMPENILDPGKVKMSDKAQGKKASGDSDSGSGDATPNRTYTGGDLVLADDEYCKIVIKGMGTYAEPNSNEQTLDSLGSGNTCYYKGIINDTHFENVIYAGKTMDDACLVIDGVTDVSQLGDVKGYISISNNETGEVLENIPYNL